MLGFRSVTAPGPATTLPQLMQVDDDSTGPQDPEADKLLAALYGELREVARRRLSRLPPGQTLSATALVHEAWLRIEKGPTLDWTDRDQFFAIAGTLMRNVLVDRAREKSALKRGGDRERVDLGTREMMEASRSDDLGAVHEILERLESEDPRSARLVVLRFFAGMTIQEAAEALEISERTARRDWSFAKAWLHRELSDED